MKNRLNFLVFICLTIVVFLFNLPSLSLAISGDDWMTISKFLSYTQNNHGLGIFSPQIYLLTNYGFQSLWLTLVYLVFKENNLGYFIVALVLRGLLAFTIYYFAKKTISTKVGILSGIVFATSSIAVESITEVSNMSVYLGIILALLACTVIATATTRRKIILGQLLGFLSYAYVPTRVFVLPGLLPLIEFLRIFTTRAKTAIKSRVFEFFVSVGFIVLIFLLPKLVFPALGWQPENAALAGNGLGIIRDQVTAGKLNILLNPLVDLGQAFSPVGIARLDSAGWNIASTSSFVYSAFWLVILGITALLLTVDKINSRQIFLSAGLSIAIIELLKIFFFNQPSGKLGEFSYFVWTYFGILYLLICGKFIIDAFILKNFKEIVFYVSGLIFTFSFLFSWLYNPFFFLGGGHRYLTLASVGIAMIIGRLLFFPSYKSRKLWLVAALIVVIVQQQYIAGRNFYDIYIHRRTAKIDQIIFKQIRNLVPKLTIGKPSLFYFEGLNPDTFFHTVAFGFGYRMQLLYNLPYGDENLPIAVDTPKALQTEMETKKIGEERIHGFRWVCDLGQECNLIDISFALREKLHTSE